MIILVKILFTASVVDVLYGRPVIVFLMHFVTLDPGEVDLDAIKSTSPLKHVQRTKQQSKNPPSKFKVSP